MCEGLFARAERTCGRGALLARCTAGALTALSLSRTLCVCVRACALSLALSLCLPCLPSALGPRPSASLPSALSLALCPRALRFAGLDWEALFAKSVAAPINPEVKSKDDTSNFDKYPDSTEDQRVKIDPRDQALFKDF